jgi:hypothetical protein
MDQSVYKKMHVKPNTPGKYLYAPQEYIEMTKKQDYVNFESEDTPLFIHLFIESKQDYLLRKEELVKLVTKEARIWISYRKSTPKQKFDINRDSLNTLAVQDGFTAYSNIALDENWSCLGFKFTN